jgi:hypothetical protein
MKTQYRNSKSNFKMTSMVDVSLGIIRVKNMKKRLATSQGRRLYWNVNTGYVEWRVF